MDRAPLEAFLGSDKLILCIKDLNAQVLYQNAACDLLCGEMEGRKCDKDCMMSYANIPDAPRREEGTQYYPNRLFEGRYYDLVFVNDGSRLVSIMYHLKDRHTEDMNELSGHGLTKREVDVASLVIKGYSNSQIAEKLLLSKGTVKIHVGNIYRKVPEALVKTLRRSTPTGVGN